ncbi:unnamed protein product, partial [Citrullus colocynthis]
ELDETQGFASRLRLFQPFRCRRRSLVAAGSSAAAADRRSLRIYLRSAPIAISVAALMDVTLGRRSAARLGVAIEAASPVGLVGWKRNEVGGGCTGVGGRGKGERQERERERKNKLF